MKLTVLGCWAPYPRPQGACSGYLLEEAGRKLLIDCGNSVFSKLQAVSDFRKLDAVIISHLHPDHFVDLFALRHALKGSFWDKSRSTKLDLYLPKNALDFQSPLSKFSDAFNIHYIEEHLQINIGGFSIDFFETAHILPCWGLVARAGHKKFVYSADTAWKEAYPGLWQNSNLLLCEASALEKDCQFVQGAHLTAGQAGQLAAQCKAGRLLLTHFYPEYDIKLLKGEASKFFDQVELAREDNTYYI